MNSFDATELLLSGSVADKTTIQAAVSADTGGTIYVKNGSRWPSNFALAANPAAQKRWWAAGSFDYGQWGTPGNWPMGPAQSWGNPVPGIGDGDQLWQYTSGSMVVTHAYTANPNNQPTMVFNYINDRTGGSAAKNGNSECVVINGYVRSGAVGNVYPLQINIKSAGNGGFGVCDVAISTATMQTGTNCGWGGVFLMADAGGRGWQSGSLKYGIEVDLYASGPDEAQSDWDPDKGARTAGLFRMQSWTGGLPRIANHLYATGNIIQEVSIPGPTGTPVLYNAMAMSAGMSGTTMPNWVLGPGSNPGLNADGTPILITDGGMTWQLTTVMNATHSRGIFVTTDPGVSVARAYDFQGTVNDCVFNAWRATLSNPKVGAALGCAPNQPIDWNRGIYSWEEPRQNTRTTMYNATTAAFEYAVEGKALLSLLDGLGAKFAAGVAAFGVTPPAAQPVITGSKSTDVEDILAQMLAALAAAGFVEDATTA